MTNVMTDCEVLAERVAVGEPVGELAAHVASCAACQRATALPALLGGTHREIDPGIGFTARVTGGAQHRIAVRHRRRVAGVLAASVATIAFAVFALTRTPADVDAPHALATMPPTPTLNLPPTVPATGPDHPTPARVREHGTHARDPDVATLVRLARVEHGRRLSARWAQIEKPLATYRTLVAHQGVSP